ncbi:MAG: hypothetical protein RMM53_02440 [Bacteroidia bacterium]|nr:hypothetical protein [Bacteroidia bacterium]
MFGVAAAVRLATAAAYVHYGSWELLPLRGEFRPFAGTDGHIQIARTLVETLEYAYFPGGPPVHNRPPLPPVLMALCCAWSCDRWHWLWFATTTLLGATTVYFAVRAMEICGASRRQTLVWGGILALHPFLVSAVRSSSFMPVGLAVVSTTTYAFCRWTMRGYRRGDAIRTGLALGAGCLTHGALAALPVLALGAAAADGRASFRRRLSSILWAASATLVVVAPWTWRNWRVFGEFIPVATGAGIQYWLKKAALAGEPDLEKRVFRQRTGRELTLDYYGARWLEDEKILVRMAWQDAPRAWKDRLKGALFFFAPPENGRFRMFLAATLNVAMLAGAAIGLKTRIWPVRLFAVGTTVAMTAIFSCLAGHASYFSLLVPVWAVVAAKGVFRKFAGRNLMRCRD